MLYFYILKLDKYYIVEKFGEVLNWYIDKIAFIIKIACINNKYNYLQSHYNSPTVFMSAKKLRMTKLVLSRFLKI